MAGKTSQSEIKIKVEGAQGAVGDLSKVDAYLKKVDASIKRMSQSATACRLDTPLTALNKLGGEANASSRYMQTLTALMPRFSYPYRLGQEGSNEQAEPLQMYIGLTQRDAEKWQIQLKDSRKSPDGALRALIAYYSEATDWAAAFEDLTKKSMASVEDAFVKMAYTGKLSFAGMVDSIIADLIRLSVRANIMGPLANIFSVGIDWLFGNTTTTSVLENPIFTPWAENFQPNMPLEFAHGGIASPSWILPSSGDFLTNPTLFYDGMDATHTQGRLSVAGEAGPEAIMPLARMNDGNLGVRTRMNTTPPVVNIPMTVEINYSGQERPSISRQRTRMDGERMVMELWMSGYENNTLRVRDRIAQG